MTEQNLEQTQPKPDAAGAQVQTHDDHKRERPTPEGDGLDPTRYGDWEKNGRCIDF